MKTTHSYNATTSDDKKISYKDATNTLKKKSEQN